MGEQFAVETFSEGRTRVWGWSCACDQSDFGYPSKKFATESGEEHRRRRHSEDREHGFDD